jgi:hypothetical protein
MNKSMKKVIYLNDGYIELLEQEARIPSEGGKEDDGVKVENDELDPGMEAAFYPRYSIDTSNKFNMWKI